jgi:FkbM family methyltransferase
MIKDHLESHKEEYKKWLVDGEQGRVDIKILPYLKDIEKGFFIEAGALDGLFMSNTKILEDLGWDGILVEPSPKAAQKCRDNRKCAVEQCALVSNDFKEKKVAGDFFFDGGEGLGAWSGIHRSHYGIKAAVLVHALTLDRILEHYGVKKVDFFSLDVEGYELEVLKGVDLEKIDITYILIEVNLSDYSLEDLNQYLAKYGYKNLGCLSGFTEGMDGWNGSHNDYIFKKN